MTGSEEAHIASLLEEEEIAPLLRAAFERSKPETVVETLQVLSDQKEQEVKELCRVYYTDFVQTLEELHGLRGTSRMLQEQVMAQNDSLQTCSQELLAKLEELETIYTAEERAEEQQRTLEDCALVLRDCAKLDEHFQARDFQGVLHRLELIRRHVCIVPCEELQAYVAQQAPQYCLRIQRWADGGNRRVAEDFREWMVQARQVAKDMGHYSISYTSTERQHEEALRKEQFSVLQHLRSNSGQGTQEEMVRKSLLHAKAVAARATLSGDTPAPPTLDLHVLHKCHHVSALLEKGAWFSEYYLEQRREQMKSDLQTGGGKRAFLENYQSYFLQLAGFFAVEDLVLRTTPDLLSTMQVDGLWGDALRILKPLLEAQQARMQSMAEVMVLRDFLHLFQATMQRFGFATTALEATLEVLTERYQALLLADHLAAVRSAIESDSLAQVVIGGPQEYESSVRSLGLHAAHAAAPMQFPAKMRFSAMVPALCHALWDYLSDATGVLREATPEDTSTILRKQLSRFLTLVVKSMLLPALEDKGEVAGAMQMVANADAWVRMVPAFDAVVQGLCWGGTARATLQSGVGDAEEADMEDVSAASLLLADLRHRASQHLSRCVAEQVRAVLAAWEALEGCPEAAPVGESAPAAALMRLMESTLRFAEHILPAPFLQATQVELMQQIARGMMSPFVGEAAGGGMSSHSVTPAATHAPTAPAAAAAANATVASLPPSWRHGYTAPAVERLQQDVTLLNTLVCNLKNCPEGMRLALAEPLQFSALILTGDPRRVLDPVIQTGELAALSLPRVAAALERYRDTAVAQSFFSRSSSKYPLRRDMEALVRELRAEINQKEAQTNDVVPKPKASSDSTPGFGRAVSSPAAAGRDTPVASLHVRGRSNPHSAEMSLDRSASAPKSRPASAEAVKAPKPRAGASSRELLYARVMGEESGSGESAKGGAGDAGELTSRPPQQQAATPASSSGTSAVNEATAQKPEGKDTEERGNPKKSSRELLYARMMGKESGSGESAKGSAKDAGKPTSQLLQQQSATPASSSCTSAVKATAQNRDGRSAKEKQISKQSSRERLYAMMNASKS